MKEMKLKGQKYAAVVFDMDGVIFDSERLVIECWKVIACKYGIVDVETVCRDCLGINKEASRRKFLEYYGENFPYDAYKSEMSALYHERYSGGRLPMKPGIKELLIFLRENGKHTALASSTRRQVVTQELTDAGLMGYFDEIICGDMVARSKPEPDIYLKACECLGVAPEDAYAVEDSYNGIRSAAAAGLKPVMVPDLAEPTVEMEALAEVILPSLLEVREYLSL